MTRDTELAVDDRAELGESPIWDDRTGQLLWVDILAGVVKRWSPGSDRVETLGCGQHVGAVALRENGGLVTALRDGFGLAAPGGPVELAVPVDADLPSNRMNDGKVDSAGRFWAGTTTYAEVPGRAALYRLDPDLSVVMALDGVGESNGLCWSRDDRLLYYVDSLLPTVDVFDFDAASGAISNRRTLITIEDGDGVPDGLTIDADGNLWLALWGGGQVRRYAPDGTLDDVVQVPAAQVTSCTFGGPDLGDLYITSARTGLTHADLELSPHAGGVFRVRPGATGLPSHRFRG
jgi:sugar lactone lactonase YvrE